MENVYNDSGYGWCDLDKEDELVHHEGAVCGVFVLPLSHVIISTLNLSPLMVWQARFLVVCDKAQENRLVGFIHFRFTLQGEAVGLRGEHPSPLGSESVRPETREIGCIGKF